MSLLRPSLPALLFTLLLLAACASTPPPPVASATATEPLGRLATTTPEATAESPEGGRRLTPIPEPHPTLPAAVPVSDSPIGGDDPNSLVRQHRVVLAFDAAPEWNVEPTSPAEQGQMLQKLRHQPTGSRYVILAIPVHPQHRLANVAGAMRRSASPNGVGAGPAGAETSEVVFAPDGRSASFYFQGYGRDERGKAVIILNPGAPVALLVQAIWSLDDQHLVLPDVDRMTESITYELPAPVPASPGASP